MPLVDSEDFANSRLVQNVCVYDMRIACQSDTVNIVTGSQRGLKLEELVFLAVGVKSERTFKYDPSLSHARESLSKSRMPVARRVSLHLLTPRNSHLN